MRLNRGTLALLLGSIVVIAAVFMLNNSPVTAPPEVSTGTPTQVPGPVFADINPSNLTRLEILNPETGAKTVLIRTTGASALITPVIVPTEEIEVTAEVSSTEEAGATEETSATEEIATTEEAASTEETTATEEIVTTAEVLATEETVATEEVIATAEVSPTFDPLNPPTPTLDPLVPIWLVGEATVLSNLPSDLIQAENAVLVFAALQATDRLTDVNPADFGLDQPRYILTATGADGKIYKLDIGVKSPTAARYYALAGNDLTTVYVVQSDQIDSLIALIDKPPYVPTPTATATPTITPNPFSEVEQTQTAVFNGTLTQAAATFSAPLFSTPGLPNPLPTQIPTIAATATEAPVVTEEATATEAVSATEESAATPEVTPTST